MATPAPTKTRVWRQASGVGAAGWGLAVLSCPRKVTPSFLALNPGEKMGLQVLCVLCLS